MTVYHVSEESNIEVLEPRRADGAEAVVASTLEFSVIRWRNASPRYA
jgi:hypothetical protein